VRMEQIWKNDLMFFHLDNEHDEENSVNVYLLEYRSCRILPV
jgi:hypothetical protein